MKDIEQMSLVKQESKDKSGREGWELEVGALGMRQRQREDQEERGKGEEDRRE